jgi:hypothetical protein
MVSAIRLSFSSAVAEASAIKAKLQVIRNATAIRLIRIAQTPPLKSPGLQVTVFFADSLDHFDSTLPAQIARNQSSLRRKSSELGREEPEARWIAEGT